jgi:hypothetical protein
VRTGREEDENGRLSGDVANSIHWSETSVCKPQAECKLFTSVPECSTHL